MTRSAVNIRTALILLLAILCSSAPVQAQPAARGDNLRYTGIEQVTLGVENLERSRQFYTRLFGAELEQRENEDVVYFGLGDSVLTLEERPALSSEVGLGMDGFDAGSFGRYLDQQELPWRLLDSPPAALVEDRNGIRARILAAGFTEPLRAGDIASARPKDGAAVFRPLIVDELFLTVRNLEVDSLFYSRLLHHSGTLQAGSLWYVLGNARLRVTQAPPGQPPGVNYFAVLISTTDLEAAADAVFAAGGIIETLLPNGFSFWDPDGHRVLVRTAPLVLDKNWPAFREP